MNIAADVDSNFEIRGDLHLVIRAVCSYHIEVYSFVTKFIIETQLGVTK